MRQLLADARHAGASLVPLHSSLPAQSRTSTWAPATGRPLSSEVTHTSEDWAPSLKCAAMLVTRAALRT
jgi:hypothetical protein